ncbi:hypothetical protein [Fusibacter ferrireducens]|nr:hypothetical protein [Fusibacter ferrireducens]
MDKGVFSKYTNEDLPIVFWILSIIMSIVTVSLCKPFVRILKLK